MGSLKKIVFIFGAGASRSISCEVPLMNDFFQKAAEYLQKPKEFPEFWLAFVMLERYRLFQSPNGYLENLAMFILRDHWHMLEISRLGVGRPKNTNAEEYKRIEKDWLKFTELYYKGLIKDSSRCLSNLETVFGRAEKQLYENGEDDAYIRLLYAISRIFCELRKKFSEPELHNDLAGVFKKYLDANPKSSLFMISFNYDIWIEQAMQKTNIWSPRNGYGITFEKFIDIKLAKESYEQDTAIIRNGGGGIGVFQPGKTKIGESRTIILKPHGSLSWYYNEKRNDFLILLDEENNGSIVDNEGRWHLNSISTEDFDFANYEPLLIPPAPLKRRNHSIFWSIDKRVAEELSSADLVVVVGWSMPGTDADYIQKIKHIFEHRPEQLQKLFVCDIKKDDTIYFNFESIFKPISPVMIHSTGFNAEFIRKLGVLLNN